MAGLRERKKAKTKALLQQHALRLFKEQGYEATTVEQITEAAEVSPSTFFRYFPTKEDVVLEDFLDPALIAAFRSQPSDLNPIQALRAAVHEVFGSLPPDEMAMELEREELIFYTPELRARMLEDIARTVRWFSQLVAERVGRDADDFALQTFAGAVLGVILAAWFSAVDHPDADLLTLMDRALAQLEAGLPLQED